MSLMFNSDDYFDMRQRSAKAKKVKVSRSEFIRLLMEQGATEAEAERQAKISSILGSAVLIGNRMVSIKSEEKP